MVNQGACLLLECDEQVISDVRTSMSLIKMPVRLAHSVEEAKKVLLEKHPTIVLARLCTQEDDRAGVRLAQDLAAHPELRRVPVLALCQPNEIDLFADDLELFFGQILLPVEFPTFTKCVQEYLDILESGEVSPVANLAESIEQGPGEPVASADRKGAVALEKRMVVAYSIQLAVLEALRDSQAFAEGSPEQIPQIVADMTKQICLKYDMAS
ncbi:hypothetical protein OAO01_02390 [Oligoflexia bacterium]|nr:hypothetical protein [Oligoflexia bacterium]